MKKEKITLSAPIVEQLMGYYNNDDYQAFNTLLSNEAGKFYVEELAEEIGTAHAAIENLSAHLAYNVKELAKEITSDPELLRQNRDLARKNAEFLGQDTDELECVTLADFLRADYKTLASYSEQLAAGNKLALCFPAAHVSVSPNETQYFVDDKAVTEKLLDLYELGLNLTKDKNPGERSA